jgi:NAD(P)-dependent dehydrogenase (short-subunit alcohol dehydrogenase family)
MSAQVEKDMSTNPRTVVDGEIADPAAAQRVVATAVGRFGALNALVNNAGIFFTKPFTEYTAEDFQKLSATNLNGFIYPTRQDWR